MYLEDCLNQLKKHRTNEVVVACETSSHVWNSVSNNHNLDIYFEDCMGKGSSLGLGIALAKPTNKVIVLDGDGSLLMNLGS
jgi:sulfopyruvate decarboxylase subunit beta